jgi:hypothetical protein
VVPGRGADLPDCGADEPEVLARARAVIERSGRGRQASADRADGLSNRAQRRRRRKHEVALVRQRHDGYRLGDDLTVAFEGEIVAAGALVGTV